MSKKPRLQRKAAVRPGAAEGEPRRLRPLVAAALALAVVTIVTFAPVAQFDFVHYDDFEYIVENPHVASGLTAGNVMWALENPYSGTGGPVTWLSHMLDVELFGLDAGAHHLTSLAIHVLSAVLLLIVLWYATGATWRSAFVAVLFAVHPLHVESVAWLAERKDVLSGFFWFAGIGAYVAYVRRPGAWRYAAVLGLFVLGLMSKPMVVTLPFVFLLLDVWPLGRVTLDDSGRAQLPRLVLEKVPFVALGVGAMVLTLRSQQEIGAVAPFDAIPFDSRLANAAVSYVTYLGKTVWPAGLIPHYPFPPSIPAAAVVLSVTLLVALTAAAFLYARRAPYASLGWFWYLGTLVPVIGLVQVGGHAMADRFTYLPLTGIFIAVAWGAPVLLRRMRIPAGASAACAIALVVVCAVTARAQARIWQDGLTLWEHTVQVDPANARAYTNLGVVLAGRNRHADAVRAYEQSLRLQPGVPQTLSNLGLALEAIGQPDAAAARYTEALNLQPDYLKPRMQLAGLLAQAGRMDDAIAHYREAVRLHPDEPLARVNLAVALGQRGRPAEAIPHMLAAIGLEPHSAQWRYFAGLMMAEAGRRNDAIAMLESAVLADPAHADARRALDELRGS